MANALKNLPKICSIEFDNCFRGFNGETNGDSIYMALKHRGRPIRNLSLLGTHIGRGNLFSLCGLANKGLVGEKLILDASKLHRVY